MKGLVRLFRNTLQTEPSTCITLPVQNLCLSYEEANETKYLSTRRASESNGSLRDVGQRERRARRATRDVDEPDSVRLLVDVGRKVQVFSAGLASPSPAHLPHAHGLSCSSSRAHCNCALKQHSKVFQNSKAFKICIYTILLQKLPDYNDPDVVYHLLLCLQRLIHQGEALMQAHRDHKGFLIWCQEHLLLRQ